MGGCRGLGWGGSQCGRREKRMTKVSGRGTADKLRGRGCGAREVFRSRTGSQSGGKIKGVAVGLWMNPQGPSSFLTDV